MLLTDRKYQMAGTAITRGDVTRVVLSVIALYVADRWLDIPAVVSIPGAFLGVLVYGYFAHERSSHRKSALMEEAASAWEVVEAAARRAQNAEREHASPEVIAAWEEAYAAALDRAAITAKNLADYRSLHRADEPNIG